MYNESENTTRPTPETKEAFARMVDAAVIYLRGKNACDLACRLEAINAQYQQANPVFNRGFTAAFRSVLSHIQVNSIHFEKIGRGLYKPRHGRSETANLLFQIARNVAQNGVLQGNTPEADIDNLYVEYAHKLAQAIADAEDAGALVLAISEAIEENLRKESSDYNQIQQMSWFRVLLKELTGKISADINTLRWLSPVYDFELLDDLEKLTWHLKYNGFYVEALLSAKVTLDTAIQLCGSDNKATIRLFTAYAQSLAETGDYHGACLYGFQPLKAKARTAIVALQDADNKTQWQNKEVHDLLSTLKHYIELLKLAPMEQITETHVTNFTYWCRFTMAQKTLSHLESKVSINVKDALLALAAETI